MPAPRSPRAVLRTRRLLLEPLEDRRLLANAAPEILVPMPYVAIEDELSPIPGIVISDPDAGSGVIQVKLQIAVGQFDATPTGSSSVTGNGSASLTLTGTLAEINDTLNTLTYQGLPNDNGFKALTIEANDQGNTGGPAEITTLPTLLLVSSRNDAPVTLVPGPFTTPLNTPLDFGGIVTSDIDAGNANIQVTLTATGGVISLFGDTSALEVITDGNGNLVDGLNDPVVSVRGSQTAINVALATGIRFTPATGFVGSASIAVDTDDLGSTGPGGQHDFDTIAITVVGPPPDPNPVVSTGPASDTLTLRRAGSRLLLTSGPATLLDADYAALSTLTIDGQAGNDWLTIDYSGGDPIPPDGLAFHGGTQFGDPGDRLSIVGTGTETATYTPGGTPGPDDNSGLVKVGTGTIVFTGLEPLDMIGMAMANVTFPNGNDIVNIANGLTSGGDAAIVVSGTSGGATFESVALRNNTTVRIDTTTSDGVDTVTLASATSAHGNTNFDLITGAGIGDTLDVTGGANFAGAVNLASQQIRFPALGSVITAGGTVTLDSGSGPISDSSVGTPSALAPTLSATAGSGIALGTSVGNLSAVVTAAGAINIVEANAVTLDNVTTANGSIAVATSGIGDVVVEHVNSAASNLALTVFDGNLTSGGADPGTADIVGNQLLLNLSHNGRTFGVGPANRLELNAAQLRLTTVGGAANLAFIVDTAGGLVMNDSTMGGDGNSTLDLLVENGSLTGVVDGTVGDVRANFVVVAVTGAASTIGTSVAAPLEINANNLVTATSAGGNIFIRDVMTQFPLGLVNAGGGNVDLLSTAGPILDSNGAALNVIAAGASLRGLSGVGSSDALETQVTTLAARNTSTTTGNIQIANSGGPLTIGTVNGFAGIINSAAPAGQVDISSASPLTVLANVTSPGNVALVAGETAADNVDHLIVNPGVLVRSTSGSVTLSAGDDLTIAAGATVQAATAVLLNVDEGDLDASGATLSALGTVIAGLGAILTGGDDNDTFNALAQSTSSFAIDGEAPAGVSVGDVLNLDMTGATSPTLTLSGVGAGTWSFGNRLSVAYQSIEQVNTLPTVLPDDLIIDMQLAGFQDGIADEIFVRLDAAGTNLLIDVNAAPVFAGAAATIHSLTVIGSGDSERLRIDETAGGLPRFAGQTPAVNNLGIGGGSASPSHLNASGALLLETLIGPVGGWDASDVTFHFDGRTGNDAIDLNLITQHDTAYTSDTAGGANSGNLGTIGASGADFLMSFANLAPLNLSGIGGNLLLDATGTPTTALLVSDDGLAADGWSQVVGNGGFETTRFRGYAQLSVVGGNGGQIMHQLGLDAATSLVRSELHGGNTADFLNLGGGDAAPDILAVHSTPAQTSVFAAGDAGDDLFQLVDAGGTVDNILAQVTIQGDAGNNTLTVIDSADASSDTLLVTQSTIEGNTGSAGSPDINFSNIDVLNITATAAGDTIDAAFAPGSDLDTVNLSGWTGGDQFYLSTTDEQIGGTASGIGVINLHGDAAGNPNAGDGSDIFGDTPASLIPGTPVGLGVRMIRPSITTLINIDGGRPTALPNPPVADQPGDVLNLDVSALAPPVLVATLGANPSLPGVAQSIAAPPSHRPVNFVEIEDVNLVDEGILTDVQMGDLYVRGSQAVDSVSFAATANPNSARVRVNAFQGYFAITRRAVVYGRGGNDYLQLGNFNHPAEFYGEEGDDYLAGYLAGDKLVGGAGRDRINAGGGNNVVWGDRDPVDAGLPDTEANRQLLASSVPGSAFHPLTENLYADILSSLDASDVMYGGPGIDQLTLGGGNDYAHGGQGNDSIALGLGDDRGYGGDGNDTITGSSGNDAIDGGEGNDTVSGDGGHDVLIGGGGNDIVSGGDGNDALFDGRVTYSGASTGSNAAGDAADLALAALLADWAADFAVNNPFTDDHDGTDQLRGYTGADAFSAAALAEILDFQLGLDSLL